MASLTPGISHTDCHTHWHTHWHILGAGSLGCLWAFYLQQAGHDVTLIAKDERHKQTLLDAAPLRLLKQGQEACAGHIAITTLDDKPAITHLLICLKAHQTDTALLHIKPCVSDTATVVLLQNGMGNQQLLQALFHRCATYAALTTEAACKRDTLLVEHTGHGQTQLGAIGDNADTNLLWKLHCALPIALNPDIGTALWQKLVINCCINPLTVVYRCHNGELAHKPEAQQQIKAIIGECQSVARAIDEDIDLANMEQIVADVIEKTARNTSSMLQDVLQHRLTEIDYINGFVSRLGKQLGIPTPANDKLVTIIKPSATQGE